MENYCKFDEYCEMIAKCLTTDTKNFRDVIETYTLITLALKHVMDYFCEVHEEGKHGGLHSGAQEDA